MSNQLAEVLPKSGLVVSEKGNLGEVLCKPKVLPLKSVTLEKLEQMEREMREQQQQLLEEAKRQREQDSMAQRAARDYGPP